MAYNILNKPKQITFSDGRVIQYTYGASGQKLKMVLTQGANTTTTDYVSGFVYQNNVLSFFSSPEGRVTVNGGTMEYQYSIADHQGNTRVVFSSVTPAPLVLKATFEGDANDNSNLFLNVSNVVTNALANNTPGGTKVIRMNQTYKSGPSKSLKVYPGDKVDLEAYAYYENNTGFGTTDFSTATMITAIASAFGGVSGGGGESGAIYSGVNTAIGAWGLGGNRTDAAPAAYLNYILFDQSYHVMNMGWVNVPSSAYLAKQKISLSTVNVKEAGYIFVYLSYEDQSNNFVYFDDFKITHTKTNVIQYSDYYPFGLVTNSSWTRENSSNNYQYDAGNELNTNSGWYETFFRGYDPALGRMLQVDPYATNFGSVSPYLYSFDNPILWNDPNGDYPSNVNPFNYGTALVDTNLAWISMGAARGQEFMSMLSDWNGGSANGGSNGPLQFDDHGNLYMVRNGTVYVRDIPNIEWVRAKEIVNFGNPNQNRLYVAKAQWALDAFSKGLRDQEAGPSRIDGMILGTDNPYRYSVVAYFVYKPTTGEGHLVIYNKDKSARIISVDGKGNLTDRTTTSDPRIDLKSYTANDGFWQLPRSYAKSSLDESLGPKYSNQFWQTFTNGNGSFMTDKPFSAVGSYVSDSPFSDITFRFRFDLNNVGGHNFNVVLNVHYDE